MIEPHPACSDAWPPHSVDFCQRSLEQRPKLHEDGRPAVRASVDIACAEPGTLSLNARALGRSSLVSQRSQLIPTVYECAEQLATSECCANQRAAKQQICDALSSASRRRPCSSLQYSAAGDASTCSRRAERDDIGEHTSRRLQRRSRCCLL